MIKEIKSKEQLLGIIISSQFQAEGIHFVTEGQFSQQLAYMNHPKGKQIEPHVHNFIPREVQYTQEVLFIKSGKLRVDFYEDDQSYLESHVVGEGDVLLLASGGHGFEVLEALEMYEVKQGPYTGDQDKTRFVGVSADSVNVIGET